MFKPRRSVVEYLNETTGHILLYLGKADNQHSFVDILTDEALTFSEEELKKMNEIEKLCPEFHILDTPAYPLHFIANRGNKDKTLISMVKWHIEYRDTKAYQKFLENQ